MGNPSSDSMRYHKAETGHINDQYNVEKPLLDFV